MWCVKFFGFPNVRINTELSDECGGKWHTKPRIFLWVQNNNHLKTLFWLSSVSFSYLCVYSLDFSCFFGAEHVLWGFGRNWNLTTNKIPIRNLTDNNINFYIWMMYVQPSLVASQMHLPILFLASATNSPRETWMIDTDSFKIHILWCFRL